jgi:hypothetical protein
LGYLNSTLVNSYLGDDEDEGDVESEAEGKAKTSFQDITTSFSQPNEQDSLKRKEDEDGSSSGDDFQKQLQRANNRVKRQSEDRKKRQLERERPSILKNEILPLKIPPTAGEVRKSVGPKMKREEDPDNIPEPISIKYMREKVADPDGGKFSVERRKLIQDMLVMKAGLDGVPPPRIYLGDPRTQHNLSNMVSGAGADESESDEDEVPGKLSNRPGKIKRQVTYNNLNAIS